MRIQRLLRPSELEVIEDRLEYGSEIGRREFLEWLQTTLRDDPGRLLVLVAFVRDEPVGFVIGYHREDHGIDLLQGWIKRDVGDSLENRLLFRLCMWADDLGERQITFEVHNEIEDYLRSQWSFEPLYVTYGYWIPKDFELRGIGNGEEKEKRGHSREEEESSGRDIVSPGIS